MTKLVIVGGVAGGASAAARARRLSENAEIIMFERGEHISFANCGLPYHISGDIEQRDALLLQTPESFNRRFNVDVRTMQEVVAIDSEAKHVTVHNHVTGESYKESYDKLLLSPGAKPTVPNIEGINNPFTFNLRNIPDMDAILATLNNHSVKHATVVGGGFIGLEVVEALRQRNIDVTLVEMAPQVMTSVDQEMAGFIHQELVNNQVDLALGCALEAVSFDSEKQSPLDLTLSNGKTLATDLLILAIGVKPETTLAKSADIELGTTGGIRTNSYMQTSNDDIYAVGDAVEVQHFVNEQPVLIPLAGPANRQGRNAADNMILGNRKAYKNSQGTAICKVFDLAVASTGLNERALKANGVDYQKIYVHTASHAGYYPGAQPVSLKLIFDKADGKILGAQAIGKDGIDKRIDVLAVAQRAGMTVYDLQDLELTYAPPYGSAKDVINQAAFVAVNYLDNDVDVCHYDELEVNEDQFLLDVRNPGELAKLGTIGDAYNIPVDSLRERLDELPKDREILLYCQVGLRGNVASRILSNHGFSVKNLSGGFKTWQAAQ